ncbi:FAD-dependent oxidoreductase [Actinosynnema sp. NPDC047251]
MTNREDGVEVGYRDRHGVLRVGRGDFCVAALPLHLLARIPHLGREVTAAPVTPVPYPVGKLGIEYGRRWWEQDLRLYGGITRNDRLRRTLDQGAKIYGDVFRRDVRASFSVGWKRTPFSEGGWVEWASPDLPEYRLLTRPAGRVYFAGDWLSHWISWQNGAFLSARDAVTAIHRRVAAG